MDTYAVTFDCPRCGREHLVLRELILSGGPAEAGTVAALYGSRPVPPALAEVLNGKVRCEWAGEWVPLDDRSRVTLTPGRRY